MMGTVSFMSILFMSVSFILAVGVPVALIIYFAIKRRLSAKALIFGMVLFIVFALILEQLLHYLVLGANPKNSFIYKNTILYMLYGGLAAGIFEETARLLGFKFLIRVKPGESLDTGISYGIGHGGTEAIIVGGVAALNNIIYSIMINTGSIENIIKAVPSAQQDAFRNVISQLTGTSSPMFLVGGIERIFAIVIQISLSLLVLKAVVQKKWGFYILAIVLHAIVDFSAVLYQKGAITSIYLVELIVLILAAGIVWLTYRLTSDMHKADTGYPDLQ